MTDTEKQLQDFFSRELYDKRYPITGGERDTAMPAIFGVGYGLGVREEIVTDEEDK